MWEMGGYGYYIWPAFTLVLGGMLVMAVHELKKAKKIKHYLLRQSTQNK